MNGLDRDLALAMIGIALVACLAVALHFTFDLLATLGFSHWHWWMGFGLFLLPFGVCVVGGDEEAESRPRCEVIPLPAPRERIKAMGGGNGRVSAAERWDGRRAA